LQDLLYLPVCLARFERRVTHLVRAPFTAVPYVLDGITTSVYVCMLAGTSHLEHAEGQLSVHITDTPIYANP